MQWIPVKTGESLNLTPAQALLNHNKLPLTNFHAQENPTIQYG